MAIFEIQKPSLAGAPLLFESATPAGDWFPNTGVEFVQVVNGGPVARTVTFQAPGTCSFGATHAAHNAVVTVPPVDEAPDNRRVVGPFPTTKFNDGNNRVQITYDDASGVTLAVQASQ